MSKGKTNQSTETMRDLNNAVPAEAQELRRNLTYDQERKDLLEFGKQKMLLLFRLHFITAQRVRQGNFGAKWSLD